jgi:hypothetical protein
MIQTDRELELMQERIRKFENLLVAARAVESASNYSAMAGAYLFEIRQMQAEIHQYLSECPTVQAA